MYWVQRSDVGESERDVAAFKTRDAWAIGICFRSRGADSVVEKKLVHGWTKVKMIIGTVV